MYRYIYLDIFFLKPVFLPPCTSIHVRLDELIYPSISWLVIYPSVNPWLYDSVDPSICHCPMLRPSNKICSIDTFLFQLWVHLYLYAHIYIICIYIYIYISDPISISTGWYLSLYGVNTSKRENVNLDLYLCWSLHLIPFANSKTMHSSRVPWLDGTLFMCSQCVVLSAYPLIFWTPCQPLSQDGTISLRPWLEWASPSAMLAEHFIDWWRVLVSPWSLHWILFISQYDDWNLCEFVKHGGQPWLCIPGWHTCLRTTPRSC